jgi:hypothetical protein
MHGDAPQWWVHVGAAVIAAAISEEILRRLLRHRDARGDRFAGATVLRYPSAWKWVTWTLVAVSTAGLSWLYGYAATTATRAPTSREIAILCFDLSWLILPLVFLVLDVHGVAHEVRPHALVRVTPWRRRAELPWSRVTALTYRPSLRLLRIEADSGEGTWLAPHLSGIGTFAREVLEKVPKHVLEATHRPTRELLMALARRE